MAGKRLGRLRQWAGEVISSKEKSEVTEETRELEQDIENRRNGLHRLHLAAEQFHRNLSKKKHTEALEDPEKFLPRDVMGVVMLTHGEELGEDSAFGTCLVALGRAHCKIATSQEAFALTFKDSFLDPLERFQAEIKEYEVERKKLETRRLNYDAALTKMEKTKNSKKEKDRLEAEDELAKAKSRYEETAEDVRARMYAIQENEKAQHRDLKEFVDLEVNFAEQYLQALREVQVNWLDGRDDDSDSRRPSGPMHHFHHTDSDESGNRYGTTRSQKSIASTNFGTKRPQSRQTASRPSSRQEIPRSSAPSDSESSNDDDDDEEEEERAARSRRSSFRSRVGSTSTSRPPPRPPSRPPSRPSSRTSRKRSDSQTTTGSAVDKDKNPKSIVNGWTGWRSKKSRDRDLFSTLKDDEDDDEPSSVAHSHAHSISSLSLQSIISKAKPVSKSENSSPVPPSHVPKWLSSGNAQQKKLVRALYDFSGSADELSFRSGDEIVVVNEVLDEWWMGELGGKKGLFPTSYTEVLSGTSSPSSLPSQKLRPDALPRRATAPSGARPPLTNNGTSSADTSKQTLVGDAETDAEHPFGDAFAAPPSARSFAGFDTDSAASAHDDDSEHEGAALMPSRDADEDARWEVPKVPREVPVLPSRRAKAPPPPPPRRAAVGAGAGGVRYVPAVRDGETGDCTNFQQNPFKATGMCANCFRMHIA